MSYKFFVYTIQDPETLEIFYIGKGSKNRHKAHLTEARKWPFKPKTGTNVLKVKRISAILLSGNTPIINKVFQTNIEQEAHSEEQRLISLIKRIPDGPLLNQTNGGEGTTGYKHTKEAKKLFSQQRKGKAVTRHSDEHKAKLRVNNPGAKATQKEVIQINLDGTIFNKHSSWRKAVENSGIPKATLSSNIKPGGLPINGFFWRYNNSIDYIENKITNADELIKRRKFRSLGKCNRRAVEQLLNGKIIATYTTIREASEISFISYNILWQSIRQQKECNGYFWQYAT